MSNIKLIQQIRDKAAALQQAHKDGDQELIETLEDELFDLEEELEDETNQEYDDHHNQRWH